MAVLDAKLPAWRASTDDVPTTKAEAKLLEGKCPLTVDGGGGLPSETRLLLKDQTDASENGLWEVVRNECVGGDGTVGGTGKVGVGDSWELKRPADADSGADVTDGMLVPIEDGDFNRKTSWIQRTADPIEVGVTEQTFEALVAGSRGTAGGDLVGTYSEPSIAENVIDTGQIVPEAVGIPELESSVFSGLVRAALGTDLEVAAGMAVVKFVSSEFANATVEHGLENTPVFAVPVQLNNGAGFLPGAYVETGGLGKTKVTFRFKAGGSFSGEVPFIWFALG